MSGPQIVCPVISAWIFGPQSRYMRMAVAVAAPNPQAVMSSSSASMSQQSATGDHRLSIGFINWAHALDHFVMLIFPTVVIGLEVIYDRSYAELIALGTASFVA